jgi:hypothetical protein
MPALPPKADIPHRDRQSRPIPVRGVAERHNDLLRAKKTKTRAEIGDTDWREELWQLVRLLRSFGTYIRDPERFHIQKKCLGVRAPPISALGDASMLKA